MKATESKPTTSINHLQAKTRGQQPFYQPQGEQQGAFFGQETPAAKPFFTPFIQTKLSIGQPGDQYEQEADAMAEQVVQKLADDKIQSKTNSESSVPPKFTSPFSSSPQEASSVLQLKCAECAKEEELQQKEEEPKEDTLQMKPIFESNAEPPEEGAIQRKCSVCGKEESIQRKEEPEPSTASSNLESQLNAAKGGGSPLPEGTRNQMEGAFGADFSGVRVHTNSGAVQMNQELGAQAFTHGNDVYFNSGKYDPGSTEGNSLLGHELTHVVQQNHLQPSIVQRVKVNDGFDLALSAITSPSKLMFKLAFAAIDLLPQEERDAAIKALLSKSISLLKFIREPPDLLKQAISNAVSGPIDPTMVWPLMVSGLIGFFEHLNTLKGNDLYQKAEKAVMAQFEPAYFFGAIWGTIEGIGSWFKDIWELIKLLGEIYLYTTYPPLFVYNYSKEIKQAWEAAGVAGKWIADNKDALLELLKDKNALLAIKDSVKAAVYLMAEELGKKVGQEMLKTIDAGPFAMGEAKGKIFGYILPDIILAVGTDGISELLKGAQAIFKAIKSAALGIKEIAYIIGLIEKGYESVKAMKIFAEGSKLSELGTKIMELFENLMKVFKVEGIARKAKQEAELIGEAEKIGAEIIKTTGSKSKLSPVLSVVMDTESGKIFHGLNTPKSGIPHPDLHPILEQRRIKLPPMTESGAPGAHSEIQALNEALWHREARRHGVNDPAELIKLMKERNFSPMVKETELSEFLLHNRNLKEVKSKGLPPLEGRPPRCLNCNPMTEGVTTVNIDEKVK